MTHSKITFRVRIFFLTLIFLFIGKIAYCSETEDLKKELIFYSDKLTTIDKDTLILENKVLLIYKIFTLESDYLFLDFKNGHIKAKGNVRAINGDIQIACEEINVDILLESVKLSNAIVNLNNKVNFQAKSLFLMKNFYTVDGFKLTDEDTVHPIRYAADLGQLNIFPFANNTYFYLQLSEINADIFNWKNASPIAFPAYSFYVRNPNIARDYNYQRRIRGFLQTGSFFLNAGSDLLRGPWASATVSYFSNKYSTGFFTAEYGLFSTLAASVYHDLTDNNGNLLQFSGSYRQFDRYLKRPHFSGDLIYLHDWQYDTLSVRTTMNQSYGQLIINRLPEVSVGSIFRREINTGIRYRYNIETTRFLLQEKDKANQDIGRIRVSANLNSPKLFVNDKTYFQLMSDGIAAYYFGKETQVSFAGQALFNHDILNNFSYGLRYRQRFVQGKAAVSFENLIPNQFAGVQFYYRPFDFLELNAFSEFDIPNRRLVDLSIVATYTTQYYLTSLLFDINVYNILSSGLSANFRVRDF